jgi:hypothetical protein
MNWYKINLPPDQVQSSESENIIDVFRQKYLALKAIEGNSPKANNILVYSKAISNGSLNIYFSSGAFGFFKTDLVKFALLECEYPVRKDKEEDLLICCFGNPENFAEKEQNN